MNENLLNFLFVLFLILLVEAFFVFALVRALKKGVISLKGVVVKRDERPIMFWVFFYTYILMALVFLSFPFMPYI